MQTLSFIVISVVIAACIGGVTNHLAIKMLFHPRNKKYLAGKKIPFTPGLIPKRKEEIASSLGRVVGDYLVTSAGLTTLLQKPEFKHALESRLGRWVSEWMNKEETIEELALQFWTEDEVGRFKANLVIWLQATSTDGVEWLWDRQEQSALKLRQLLPGWSEGKKERLVERIVQYLIREIKEELKSANGDRVLRQLTGQVMENAGGLLGTLAGIFMDEDKMVLKVKQIINDKLDSPQIKGLVSDFLFKKMGQWENMPLSEAVESFAQQDGRKWIVERTGEVLKWQKWLEQFFHLQVKELLGSRREWMLTKIPAVTDLFLRLISSNIEKLVAAVNLPKLVEEQVQHFPIERLEEIILSVSGKEFRAITWLGAFLGGIIGLFQSIVLLWYL